MKIEELRLQELKLNRELAKQKEKIKYLNNILSEYEQTVSNLEEEIVQQNKVRGSLWHWTVSQFLTIISVIPKL